MGSQHIMNIIKPVGGHETDPGLRFMASSAEKFNLGNEAGSTTLTGELEDMSTNPSQRTQATASMHEACLEQAPSHPDVALCWSRPRCNILAPCQCWEARLRGAIRLAHSGKYSNIVCSCCRMRRLSSHWNMCTSQGQHLWASLLARSKHTAVVLHPAAG